MARKSQIKKRKVEQYDHKGKERVNNPPVGLVNPETDKDAPKKNYKYDPHLDPQLVWAGKAEHTSFEVPTVSLHVHERIDPRTIIEAVKRKNGNGQQQSLFSFIEENPPLREAIQFYKHKHNWSNRLIAGDSLLVMNSLLEKEGMAGKVQMIYMDPPYGIKYGSNFQPFVNKRDVKDGKDEDLSSEPEMIKAFRDTWELGIHSYLTYMRDRLLLAKKLLHESGSVFVQISDENVHHIRELMDEVFGVNNFISLIPFRKKTMPLGAKYLDSMNDYLIFYAKEKEKLKYRTLFSDYYPEGKSRWKYDDEKKEWYRLVSMRAPGYTPENDYEVKYNGEIYRLGKNQSWIVSKEKFNILLKNGRIELEGDTLSYKLLSSDFPYQKMTNFWTDTSGPTRREYVVETSTFVIQRCILMTTDPGDLVLDPTCGSGTTAYVAEQWGRRWITCDTSRVALTLAKQRIMTAVYNYYQLAHPDEGVGSGFNYKTVPHITLKSIANNEPPKQETLYDQPYIDNSKTRVTGPFTVEAVPSPVAKEIFSGQFLVSNNDTENSKLKTQNSADVSIARSGETLRQSEWRDELLNNGVRGKGGQYIKFSRVEPMSGTRYIQAEAETLEVFSSQFSVSSGEDDAKNSKLKTENSKKVFIVFGPEHAPMEQRQVSLALDEAQSLRPKADMILFAAFQFDPEAAKDIDETKWSGVTLLRVQMNADLFTDDLKKKRTSDDSFWLLGQPDVQVSSFEFLVFSNDRRLCEYETFKKLSRFNSLAEINELSEQDIQYYAILSQGRDLWDYLSDEKGWDFNTGEYRRGTGKEQQRRIPSVSWNSTRFVSGIRNFDTDLSKFGIHSTQECRRIVEQLRRNSEIISSLKEISSKLSFPLTKNLKLTTKNFSQVEVKGFDYYDTKTGNVISGSDRNIAMWMLDPDYDGRSLFPRQVFFPLVSDTEGWSKLAKNLKAEIDSELIEAYRGTVSIPFSSGEYKQCAVKIIDDRGIESLRIIRLGE